jgi:hypothetical protein
MLRRLLIVPVVALLLTVFTGQGHGAAGIRKAICPGQPVPPGWVVVGQALCGNCFGGICVIIEKLP